MTVSQRFNFAKNCNDLERFYSIKSCKKVTRFNSAKSDKGVGRFNSWRESILIEINTGVEQEEAVKKWNGRTPVEKTIKFSLEGISLVTNLSSLFFKNRITVWDEKREVLVFVDNLFSSLYRKKSRVTEFVDSNVLNGWIIFNEISHTPYGGMKMNTYNMFRCYPKLY